MDPEWTPLPGLWSAYPKLLDGEAHSGKSQVIAMAASKGRNIRKRQLRNTEKKIKLNWKECIYKHNF